MFLCAALISCVDYFRKRSDCEVAATRELLRLPVDLSTPGSFSGQFEQLFEFPCKQMIRFETDTAFASFEEVADAMKGLAGKVVVADERGTSVFDAPLTSDCVVAGWDAKGAEVYWPALRFSPFPRGHCRLAVEITEPAPAFAGTSCFLSVRYELCGLEHLVARFVGAVSLVCGLIAAAIMLSVAYVMRRSKTESTALNVSIQ